MTIITPQLIRTLNRRHPRPDVAAQKLQMAAAKFGISTPRQVAMFLAQLTHESGLIPQEENLNYRAARICQVWPGRFPTIQHALAYAFNPQRLANLVYSGRMGNGQGEGWTYRGRGLIQLTGKANYRAYGKLVGHDLVAKPDLLLQYGVSALVAGAYWHSHGLNAVAQRGDTRAVTRAINGGLNGLDDRERLYQRALNRIPRYGLLETDAPLDVAADEQADLDLREQSFQDILSLVA